MKLNWNFQRGGEVLEKSFCEGDMDIFWNYTLLYFFALRFDYLAEKNIFKLRYVIT